MYKPDQLLWDIDKSHCTPSIPPQPGVCSGNRNIGKPVLPDNFTVSNPKTITSGRLPNITTTLGQSNTLASLSTSDLYLSDTSDVVDGASMLVLMGSNSITSMKSVEKIGEEYHKEQVEEIILIFVTALILLIPGVEEVADEAGLAAIAITSRAIGATGDVDFSIYGIMSAKDGGPTGIFLVILGGLGVIDMVRAPALFAKAAKARRAITPEHIATLGSEVKGRMAQIDKLKRLCR
ncbi:hypothetical protein N7536_000837 [Penicillium majusculum]|uniref:Uncharacterized protein n=1 Tax=Penicillium solitum TaxID=60172 RepID=A0A1V6R6E2_9EURO|nr:uncharacterized protein PENSOL_c013G00185 [Penicillium solitum]KAJ5705148.1 hypothetical protein N7536_000837 [Penicillium majusculum]OQD97079.1 hypothetical protein PENSOL_c013G00185 [Penicillium solitum]